MGLNLLVRASSERLALTSYYLQFYHQLFLYERTCMLKMVKIPRRCVMGLRGALSYTSNSMVGPYFDSLSLLSCFMKPLFANALGIFLKYPNRFRILTIVPSLVRYHLLFAGASFFYNGTSCFLF